MSNNNGGLYVRGGEPPHPPRGSRWCPPVHQQQCEPPPRKLHVPACRINHDPHALLNTSNNNYYNKPLRLPPLAVPPVVTPPNVERNRKASPFTSSSTNPRNAPRLPAIHLSTAKRGSSVDLTTYNPDPRKKRKRTHANNTNASAEKSWDQQYVATAHYTTTTKLRTAGKNLSVSQNEEAKQGVVVDDNLQSYQESQQDAWEIRVLLDQVESMLPVGIQVANTPLGFNTRIPRLRRECGSISLKKDFKKNFANILALTRMPCWQRSSKSDDIPKGKHGESCNVPTLRHVCTTLKNAMETICVSKTRENRSPELEALSRLENLDTLVACLRFLTANPTRRFLRGAADVRVDDRRAVDCLIRIGEFLIRHLVYNSEVLGATNRSRAVMLLSEVPTSCSLLQQVNRRASASNRTIITQKEDRSKRDAPYFSQEVYGSTTDQAFTDTSATTLGSGNARRLTHEEPAKRESSSTVTTKDPESLRAAFRYQKSQDNDSLRECAKEEAPAKEEKGFACSAEALRHYQGLLAKDEALRDEQILEIASLSEQIEMLDDYVAASRRLLRGLQPRIAELKSQVYALEKDKASEMDDVEGIL
eukprot:scaffold8306_cov171-Amphora_coffeaeformis.AAC.2